MDEGLSRAVLRVFVELYRNGLIYKDKRLVNWDPNLLTAISDLEVQQVEVKGHLWHIRYPLEGVTFDADDPATFITVATTRPETMFPLSDLVRIDLGAAGFERLAEKLDATFARGPDGLRPEELGPGLYGASLFFRANGAFHLFNVCNHWIAGLLDAAGVPTAPVLATLPFGLLLDLEWRSNLVRLPPSPVSVP